MFYHLKDYSDSSLNAPFTQSSSFLGLHSCYVQDFKWVNRDMNLTDSCVFRGGEKKYSVLPDIKILNHGIKRNAKIKIKNVAD